MARTNFQFAKRQKELERKRKTEEKRQRKREKKSSADEAGPGELQTASGGEKVDPAAEPSEEKGTP